MPGIPEAVPHTLVADVSGACSRAAVALMEKRSRAIADYWRAVAAVREPSELYALNLGYCSQMLDDYAAAYAEGLKPIGGAADEAAAEPAPERAPAQAA
jgi:hypothetical protein